MRVAHRLLRESATEVRELAAAVRDLATGIIEIQNSLTNNLKTGR
jgi:hypothetical protein